MGTEEKSPEDKSRTIIFENHENNRNRTENCKKKENKDEGALREMGVQDVVSWM